MSGTDPTAATGKRASFDIAIVGGGPAGLMAAITAGRMNRRAILLEAGVPRTAHAPCYHNYLGFPEGISGEDLMARGTAQAERWGATLVEAAVTAAEATGRKGRERFRVETTAGEFRAAGIVLATGVKDRQIACGDLYSETDCGVHYCVVCDGRETVGSSAAVIGCGETAYEMATALLDFTPHVTLLLDGEEPALDGKRLERLRGWGVPIVADPLESYRCAGGGIVFATAGGELVFPHVFIARGTLPRTDVAESLGCDLDGEGYIVTDERQATTVPYVHAAGDCDGGHKQVTQAIAEGELAVLQLVQLLRRESLAGGAA